MDTPTMEEVIKKLHEKVSFIDDKFPAQASFIRDSSRMKASCCTRRSGKSYADGLMLVKTAYENPGVSCLYIALTEDTARKIMIKDVFKIIDSKYSVKMKFRDRPLSIELPNGSIIYLLGVDSSADEMEKLLGQKYRIVVIDEAQSFAIDLKGLIYRTLLPATADLKGPIILSGTPGNLAKGLYYDVTTGVEKGWSVHKWSAIDNPYMKEQWLRDIGELKRLNPLIEDTPWFQQMYLGKWTIDSDKLVYKYSRERNSYIELPSIPKGEWHHILGIDLGYDDDSAFVVAAYHDHDPCLYFVESYSKKGMDITNVANMIKTFDGKYNVEVNIIDGANKQAVEEIRKRHGIPLVTADKTGKSDFIEILNSELITSRVKAGPNCRNLIQEWESLIWDDNANKRIEHPSLPNHNADAALYAWRHCYSYLSTKAKIDYKKGSIDWLKEQAEEMEQIAEKNNQQSEENIWGDEWN